MSADRRDSASRPPETAASVAMTLAKKALRARCRQAREALGAPRREQASRRICERIARWEPFREAHVVLTYLPMSGEVDLRPLIDQAPTIQWAIPRILRFPEPHLLFHAYQPDRLVAHRYGILEPDPSAPLVSPDEADLILVPGLAFTRGGFRLGYGGGYYDRLLARPLRGATLGICFQALLLEELPCRSTDLPVGHIVTEAEGVIPCSVPA